eukprot:10111790-Alexandrium_andersonii.AAC.1
MADGPACVFRDVLDFVCPCHRQAVGLDSGLEESPRVLRSLIPRSTPAATACCLRDKKHCYLTHADERGAGAT